MVQTRSQRLSLKYRDRDGGAPRHPGYVLNREVHKHLKLPRSTVIEYLGVSHSLLSKVLAMKLPVTPDFALRWQHAFGGAISPWLRMAMEYHGYRVPNDLALYLCDMQTRFTLSAVAGEAYYGAGRDVPNINLVQVKFASAVVRRERQEGAELSPTPS